MIPETEVVDQNPYAIDAKLDFLCGLMLLPTPLVTECPNATKKWLKASVPVANNDGYASMTGINSYDPSAHLSHSVHFNSVFMDDEICHSPSFYISATNQSPMREQPAEENMLLHESDTVEAVKENTDYVTANLEMSASDQKDQTLVCKTSVLFDNDKNETLLECVKTKNAMTHFNYSFDTNTADTDSEMKALPSRVQNEIFKMEINQTIFAVASINKSQGYLSDMLRNCTSIVENGQKSLSSSYRNLLKMINFLQKPCEERKICYQKVQEKSKNKKQTKPLLKQRTKLSDETKSALIEFFHGQNGKISNNDLERLALQHGLTVQNIRIFYKNTKRRKKL